MPTFTREIRVSVPVKEAFEWHKREGAFERLQPPWEKVFFSRIGGIDSGIATIKLFGLTWQLQHCDYQEGIQFKDIQIKGPFKKWEHVHSFHHINDNECILRDVITYELPFAIYLDPIIKKKLNEVFVYRHSAIKADLEAHHKYRGDGSMRILIAGASGLIGSALKSFFKSGGHEVISLVRKENSDGLFWDPEKSILSHNAVENFDVIINLSGENIAGRWSEEKKRRIKQSRILSTSLLANTIARLKNPPKTFINASAIGYYGNNASGTVTESSPSGKGFLAEVCKEWEAAALPAKQAGVRVAYSRFGAVLSPKGGALATMLIPFKLGLGGKIGSGKQWMSWIAIDDVIHAINHVIHYKELEGPINFTTPNPVQNEEFTKILGQVLQRPTYFPLPSVIAKFMLGEMADEVLLSSVKAEPLRLVESNYSFLYPNLKDALIHMVGR